jgi:hypothetical protein
MYTNIPVQEVKSIVKDVIEKYYNTSNYGKDEILDLLNVTLEQNYIQHNGQWYKQDNGPMGAPTSAILTETFMQYIQHKIIVDILMKYQIIDYYRYVDDILIIYNTQTTNIHNALNEFNRIHPKLSSQWKKSRIIKSTVGTSHNTTGNPYSFRQTILFLRSGNPYSQRHQSQSQSHVTTDGQSVGLSWCRAPFGAHDQIFILFESYSPVFMGRPL